MKNVLANSDYIPPHPGTTKFQYPLHVNLFVYVFGLLS